MDIATCGTLSASTSYTLTANVSAGAGNTCFTIGGLNVTLDLNGFTVTGRIKCTGGTNCNGLTILGGAVSCSYTAPDRGCIRADLSNALTARIVLHDLTVTNTATSASSKSGVSIDWQGRAATDYIFEGYNLTMSSNGGSPASSRIINLEIISAGTSKVYDSTFTCKADDNACQGIVFFAGRNVEAYGNTLVMETASGTSVSNRGIVVDNDQPGDASGANIHNNVCTANDQRCFRFRNATNFSLHHNTVNNITGPFDGFGIIHVGDPDYSPAPTYSDYNAAKVWCNTFNMAGGTALGSRDAKNWFVRSNTFTGATGRVSITRTALALESIVTIENNTGASGLGTASTVETGATVNHCLSGSFTGAGTIVDSCPGATESCGTAAPLVSLNRSSIAFQAGVIETTSGNETFTLTNTGDATLNITSIVTTGAAFINTTTCGATLGAGLNCTVTVTARAKSTGAATGTVTFTTDAAGSPHTVALSGSGIALLSFGGGKP